MARGEGGTAQGELAIEIPETAMALQIQYIPWDLIFPDPAQPRVEADGELRASIAAGGIRQPITVRPRPEAIGQYQIVDGERRWRGAKDVQARIPCVVRLDMEEDFERVRAQLITNTGKPLTPVEEARAMAALMAARHCSITELAQQLGKPVTTVSQRLNLMQLGPWLDLIQRGTIKYTHAAEVLLRYRGCPDAVHVAVIAAIEGHLAAPHSDEDSAFDSARDFERIVEPQFRKHLYPITKKKHDPKPSFETAMHDRECACGGVELKDWDGKRRYCGNPDWWRPLEREAKKAEKKKAASSASSPSGSSEVAKPFYAPDGVKDLGETGHLDVPKGYARLVGYSGKYNTFEDGRPFDPADLGEIDVGDLAVQGARGYRQLLVKETPALERARHNYAAKLAVAQAPVRKKFKAKLEKAIDVAVRRDSARAILAVIAASADLYDFEVDEDLEEALAYAGVDIARDLVGDRHSVADWEQFLEAQLTDAQAAVALEALVTLRRWTKGDRPRLIADLQAIAGDLRAEIEKRRHPWAKPPKAGKVK